MILFVPLDIRRLQNQSRRRTSIITAGGTATQSGQQTCVFTVANPLVSAWIVSPLSICGSHSSNGYILCRNVTGRRENCCVSRARHIPKDERNPNVSCRKNLVRGRLSSSPRTSNFTGTTLCFKIFEDYGAVIKMIINGEKPDDGALFPHLQSGT